MSYYYERRINDLFLAEDSKHLCLAHDSGCQLYKTSDLFLKKHLFGAEEVYRDEENKGDNNYLLIRKHRNLIVCVTQADTRVLSLWKIIKDKKELIYKRKFSKSIVGIEINKDRLITRLEDTIYIFTLHGSELLHTVRDIQFSTNSVFDLTQQPGLSLIAFPRNSDTGTICIFDASNCHSIRSFNAHVSHVACVKFNQQRTMIATASVIGTVIRVFGVSRGEKLFEFRRGMSTVKIQSLCFSEDSKFLCSTSDFQTVHLFKLEDDKQKSSLVEWYESIVPSQLNYSIAAERSFAQVTLPIASSKNTCSIIKKHNQYSIVVATNDGFVYLFNLENETEQLCLMKQHRIAFKKNESAPRRKLQKPSIMESIEEGNENEKEKSEEHQHIIYDHNCFIRIAIFL